MASGIVNSIVVSSLLHYFFLLSNLCDFFSLSVFLNKIKIKFKNKNSVFSLKVNEKDHGNILVICVWVGVTALLF